VTVPSAIVFDPEAWTMFVSYMSDRGDDLLRRMARRAARRARMARKKRRGWA